MKFIKHALNYIVTLCMSVVLLYLAQEFVKEVKTYEEVDYSDVAGCPADPRDDYQEASWDYIACS